MVVFVACGTSLERRRVTFGQCDKFFEQLPPTLALRKNLFQQATTATAPCDKFMQREIPTTRTGELSLQRPRSRAEPCPKVFQRGKFVLESGAEWTIKAASFPAATLTYLPNGEVAEPPRPTLNRAAEL